MTKLHSFPILFLAVALVSPSARAEDAAATHHRGHMLLLRGQYAEAQPLLETALGVVRANSNAPDRLLVDVLSSMAQLLRETGELSRAEDFARQAVAAAQTLDHAPLLASTLGVLGSIAQAQGRTTEAVQVLERALAIRERLSPPDPSAVADSLSSLGYAYRLQNRLDESARLLERARVSLPAGHIALPAVLNHLGNLRLAQGRAKDARKLIEEAVALWEQRHGPDHPHIAAGLATLATIAQVQHDFGRASRLMERARRIDERSFPADHVRVAYGLNNRAALAAARRRFTEAESLLNQALPILERKLPPGHPETGKIWGNLSAVYAGQNRWEAAAAACQRALETLRAAWGPRDLRLVHLLEQSAQIERARERYVEAARLEMQATSIRVTNTLR